MLHGKADAGEATLAAGFLKSAAPAPSRKNHSRRSLRDSLNVATTLMSSIPAALNGIAK